MNITFVVSVSVHSLGRTCQWLPVWHLCQSVTQTRQHPAPSSTLQCLENKTLLLPFGAAMRITHRQDIELCFYFVFVLVRFFNIKLSVQIHGFIGSISLSVFLQTVCVII